MTRAGITQAQELGFAHTSQGPIIRETVYFYARSWRIHTHSTAEPTHWKPTYLNTRTDYPSSTVWHCCVSSHRTKQDDGIQETCSSTNQHKTTITTIHCHNQPNASQLHPKQNGSSFPSKLREKSCTTSPFVFIHHQFDPFFFCVVFHLQRREKITPSVHKCSAKIKATH